MNLIREAALLESCGSVLAWDRETFMPSGGTQHRAAQLSLLAGLAHDRMTSTEMGDLLGVLEQPAAAEPLTEDARANVREVRRTWRRVTRLPRRLVEELSHATTIAQERWVAARKQSDFSLFSDSLKQIVALKREEAQAVGWSAGGEAYDALLDDYEPGATSADLDVVFRELRAGLVPLISGIQESGIRAPATILARSFPVDVQRTLVQSVAADIGFDFTRGRLDTSAHPFCSGCGPSDCRLTTRFDEHGFSGAFFGTLHEAGHGMYEQGLPAEHAGTPLGTARSLGVHESQSRLWENLVGRSESFWRHYFPRVQSVFPGALGDVAPADFLRDINHVAPSFIRVEADEVTYNLHIMLRFDLERALISGSLQVDELPSAWNDRFTADFGMTPPDDARGCLQDIHWSAGLFGYFPTYTLGNIYASQLFDACRAAHGDVCNAFAAGSFDTLRNWLREHIHRHGQRFTTAELIQRATGESLNQRPLLDHLWNRFGHYYELQ